MTGIEILRRVKENAVPESTPVVVLTTTDDSQEIKRCYELGCNVYITKPVNYESFANAIRQLGLFFSVIQVPPAPHDTSHAHAALHRRRRRARPAGPARPGAAGLQRRACGRRREPGSTASRRAAST